MPAYACPECHKPIGRVKLNQDARCDACKTELVHERRRREREKAEQV